MMAIYVSELKLPSLSSRNTLGDTSHNSNKIGLSWGGKMYGGQGYAEMVVVVDEEVIVPK